MRSTRGHFDLILIILEPLRFRPVEHLNTSKVNRYALITRGGCWGLLKRIFQLSRRGQMRQNGVNFTSFKFFLTLSFRPVERSNTLKVNQYGLMACGVRWWLLKRVFQLGQKRGQIGLNS